MAVAEGAAVIFRCQREQHRRCEPCEIIPACCDPAGDDGIEGNREAGAHRIEVVADRDPSRTHSGEEQHEPGGKLRPYRICRLKPGELAAQKRERIAHRSTGIGHGDSSTHGRNGECEEGHEGRYERLPGDVDFHVGRLFSSGKISEKSRNNA